MFNFILKVKYAWYNFTNNYEMNRIKYINSKQRGKSRTRKKKKTKKSIIKGNNKVEK